jgi:hypothetical protein
MNFTSNCDYEKHLEEEHKSNKKFSCKDCGKGFVIRWRLKKHENIHTSTMKKNCHFFNNNKRCPYEDLGCMFLHQKSPMWIFDRLCSNLKCSFGHSPSPSDFIAGDTNENEFETVAESYESGCQEMMADQKSEPFAFSTSGLFANCFSCYLCKFTSPSAVGLTEHGRGNTPRCQTIHLLLQYPTME